MTAYLDTLMPENDPLLITLREYAKEHNVPIITREGERFLNQLIALSNAKHILEIGTAIGYSAISMTKKHPVTITTIERDPSMIEAAKQNFNKADVTDRITLIEADALNYEPKPKIMFDLIFIDAAKAQYIKFFEKYTPFLKVGGIVVTDNLLFHGLIDQDVDSRNLRQLLRKLDNFNQYIVSKADYDTEIYSIGDGMSVSIKRK
ncbi:MAG: O-methyltransferase [Candidatus Izemoplasma sp.]|nr:O-methyltransferase [Candidatus Izemoplasma sp.]